MIAIIKIDLDSKKMELEKIYRNTKPPKYISDKNKKYIVQTLTKDSQLKTLQIKIRNWNNKAFISPSSLDSIKKIVNAK